MLFSSLRHIILLVLASLLMNRAASQYVISPFLAASASKKILVQPAATPISKAFVMDQRFNQYSSGNTQSLYVDLRPNHYAATMAWTCRQELRLEKFLTLPLKISLGSKEQVDWLEGKNQMPR
jgi:hypothetical protein